LSPYPIDMVTSLDTAAWQVAGHEARELRRVERMQAADGLPVWYLVARAGRGEPVGILPIYPTAGPLPPALGLGTDVETCWFLGSPGLTPAVMPVAPPHPAGPVRAALAREALVLAARTATVACFPLVDDDIAPALTPLVPPAERLVAHGEEAYLDIRFDSWEGYLRTLGRDRRKKVRKERRRFHESGLRLADGDLSTDGHRLARLLYNVEAKYGVQVPVERYEAYLASVARDLDGETRCLVLYDGHEPVAFTVVWMPGPVWRLRCWGGDYTYTRDSYVYFNVNIYEPLRLAAEAGAERLVLGEGTLTAKRRRGALTRRLTTITVPLAARSPANR
jgi:Acetyltransferase (GNAT) domain